MNCELWIVWLVLSSGDARPPIVTHWFSVLSSAPKKEGLFRLQTRLLCTPKKACLQLKQGLFANQAVRKWRNEVPPTSLHRPVRYVQKLSSCVPFCAQIRFVTNIIIYLTNLNGGWCVCIDKSTTFASRKEMDKKNCILVKSILR